MASHIQNRNEERAFPFLRINERGLKPRAEGITEIRGPYYSPLAKDIAKNVHLEGTQGIAERYATSIRR